MIYGGRTLFISHSAHLKNHLWVVLNDPVEDQVVMVSMTTRRDGSDLTVGLVPGDHPFVVRETVMHYPDTRLVRASQLQALLESGATSAHSDCSDELLNRIRAGLFVSPFVEPYKVGWYRQYVGGPAAAPHADASSADDHEE